jgi:hypothetical protein
MTTQLGMLIVPVCTRQVQCLTCNTEFNQSIREQGAGWLRTATISRQQTATGHTKGIFPTTKTNQLAVNLIRKKTLGYFEIEFTNSSSH